MARCLIARKPFLTSRQRTHWLHEGGAIVPPSYTRPRDDKLKAHWPGPRSSDVPDDEAPIHWLARQTWPSSARDGEHERRSLNALLTRQWVKLHKPFAGVRVGKRWISTTTNASTARDQRHRQSTTATKDVDAETIARLAKEKLHDLSLEDLVK